MNPGSFLPGFFIALNKHMSHRIRCCTLFNITYTGVMNRTKPNQNDIQDWLNKRNTQCNFDTILQIISLRSQPEVVKMPVKVEMTPDEFNLFGFVYKSNEDKTDYCWKFEFEVQHSSVFENGLTSLGALYSDCAGVPMIQCTDQINSLPALIDITEELRNIYFEVI
jgi:hypothetical protein